MLPDGPAASPGSSLEIKRAVFGEKAASCLNMLVVGLKNLLTLGLG